MSEAKKKIAVVGMACRFPGEATSPEAYWEVLKNGKDVVTEISSDRWGTDFYKHPNKKEPGKSYTFAAGVLDQVDEFDAAFFGISPREAAQMDPQQRLLLELTWEALEDGNQIPESLAGSQCAVYVGIASTDYAHRRMDDLSSLDPYSMTGNTASIASNRISYIYDLHGPSVSVDTACSSSLVALHQACNAIWNGDAPSAITGGVNMLLHPFGFVGFSKASMLSPRGRCRAFDATGDGYVRAEGSAVLFLKPLEDAERDGDPIHAVIVDTAINSDGKTNGITLPSVEGQADLLATIYARAGVKPDDLSYLEAHGTGTVVGDPLEAGALAKVLSKPRKVPLPIGSAKTNLGHLETASGMAGLLKVILSLKNKAIPPSLHFEQPNPNIDFDADKLSVVTTYTPLKISKKPHVMGVNSFGFGGANAHAIVEEYISKGSNLNKSTKKKINTKTTTDETVIKSPLFLSAQSDSALKAMAGQYRDILQLGSTDYEVLAYASYKNRQRFSHGLAVHGDKLHDVTECLHAYSQGEIHTGTVLANKIELKETDEKQKSKGAKLALVFSGNGSQWQGMGCELLKTEPLFLATIVKINELLNEYCDISLLEEFNATVDESKLHLTEIAQPLLFAFQVGVIKLLKSKGLVASAVVGHSVGEVAAAWAAGALSLDQAVKVIYQRSQAQAKTAGTGRMAAAAMSHSEVLQLIDELDLSSTVTVAGVNSPKSVTLSGSLKALQIIEESFEDKGIFYRLLDLNYAFHSAAMDLVENEIKQNLKDIKLDKNSLEFYSTVTGDKIPVSSLDADYWWRNIRQPVQFAEAMEQLLNDGYQVFLEIGPHPVLRSYINECGRDKDFDFASFSTIKRQSESKINILNALYSCHLAGCDLKTSAVFSPSVIKMNIAKVRLPHYPWQHEKHWYSLTAEGGDLVNRDREHPLLGYRVKNYEACWENQVDTALFSYLADHVVDGGAVMPAAAYVEMALAASAAWFIDADEKHQQWEIENLEIRAPIVLDHSKTLRFKLLPKDTSFVISSRDRLSDGLWTENVVGRLLGTTNKVRPEKLAVSTFVKQSNKTITATGHYQLTEAVGLSYGPSFQGVEEVWISSLTALAKLKLPQQLGVNLRCYKLHPVLLDAGFQVLVDIFSEKISQGNQAALIPVQIGKLYYYESVENLTYLSVSISKQSPQSVVADYSFLNAEGKVLVELKGCRFKGIQLMRSKAALPESYEFKPFLMPYIGEGLDSPMPEPALLVAHAVDFLNTNKDELQRDRHYQQVLPLFDLMVSMFVWQAIRQLNPKGDEFTIESLAEQAHIESIKFPLLSRLLSILVEDDLASYENDQWLLATSSDLPSAEDIWLSVLGDSPDYLPELMLLGRCGKHLADVLQNNIQSEALLYSEKSSIQEHWSGASPSNISMNLALRDILTEIVTDWPANRRIKVLEIGGSNTEISQKILPVFPQAQCDYYYSNQDESLLLNAGFDLEEWSFVTPVHLDISHKLTDDNTPLGFSEFDIIIAANTLYRSDDCSRAQLNIKKLLAPKGVLLMLERESDRFMDITFGLQNDWWVHSSSESGAVPLLMGANSWRADLKEAGFNHIELLVEPEATGDVGAFMVVAQNSKDEESITTTDKFDVDAVQTWMVLKDASEISSSLSQSVINELNRLGQKVVIVEAADTYKRLGQMHFSININTEKEKEEHFDHIFSTLQKLDVHCDQIIHLMGMRWHSESKYSEIGKLALQQLRCASTIDLIKGLNDLQLETPQLNLVSSGGALITNEDLAFPYESNPSQSPIWGLGRVIMNEHPDLNCQLIDLQGSFEADSMARMLIKELMFNSKTIKENEIILSDTVRQVLRMSHSDLSLTDKDKKDKNIDFALKFSSPGQLKNLIWEELPDSFCQADQIEIRPYATGLNFRDVMYAMGLLSDEAVENGFAGPTLGMEVSGVVTKIGSAVTEFKEGDEVVGFAPACFSSRVISQTTAITKKPKSWSFEEAATIPTTFFTVYYTLKHLAQIQPGEKILIHGAAGGVGIAAIQYARYCGAEIFATAGSDEKRDFVRLLGADHVMDSRSLAFADDILQITQGEGVDIVLNSLAGEAITRNLAVLKPFGRFLELGKRDFYENSKIGLRPFRNNISYFGIDADQLLVERPDLASRLFKEMMSLFEDGNLRPMPYRSFPATRIEDAFRYMQQSRQIGKVVVSFENGNSIPLSQVQKLPNQGQEFSCDPNGCYLITGGLSGFGLKTASWLVQKGAKSLVLISRSANIDEGSKVILDSLQSQDVAIYTRACDVCDKASLLNLVQEVQKDISPIRGLIHAAMVLDDSLIRNMTQNQLLKVLQPKVSGAWNLHEVTSDIQLDFFVLYSSATTFVGNPGQANYVAANSYMESLVNYRRAKGLPACFAAWGAISDVGYLARNKETKEALQSRLGGEALNSDQALKILEKIILGEKYGSAVIDLDWGVIQRVMPAANSAKYEVLQRNVKHADNDHEDIHALIANLGSEQIQELVIDLLLDEIEQILRLPREKLDVERSIFDLGMDSLMGMELVLAIEERFDVKLPVMALTEGSNILRIAERITVQLSDIDTDINIEDLSKIDTLKEKHDEDISVAALRHGHTTNMTESEAEALSKKLIEDAMKH